MRKKMLLAIAFILIVCNTVYRSQPEQMTEAERAIRMFSKTEEEARVLRGIRYAESVNGKYTWSDSTAVVSNQRWAKEYKYTDRLYAWYGRSIYACVGDWNVLFLTAYERGYRGTPWQLRKNIYTNCKYAVIIYRMFASQEESIEYSISRFNAGTIYTDRHGNLYNQEYVDKVMGVYNEQCLDSRYRGFLDSMFLFHDR